MLTVALELEKYHAIYHANWLQTQDELFLLGLLFFSCGQLWPQTKETTKSTMQANNRPAKERMKGGEIKRKRERERERERERDHLTLRLFLHGTKVQPSHLDPVDLFFYSD